MQNSLCPLRPLRSPVQILSRQFAYFADSLRRDWNADVEAEAVAHAVEELADDNFGRRVLAADAAHVPGAAFFGETVTHRQRF